MKKIILPTICASLLMIIACEKQSKEPPIASFTISTDIARIGETIYFQNTSEGANSFEWDFGDGNSSIEENPNHIYTANDRYTVSLKVSNADGSDENSQDLKISFWSIRADMPTGRWELSTCVVDGKIYAIGGAGPVYEALHTVEQYDPATDTWTSKSDMPTARQGLSTSVVNGKIYAIGGGSGSDASYSLVITFSTVEEYDPATDTWTTRSDMPTSRGFHSANVVDGKIYIIGGSHESGPWQNHVSALEVYDPGTDTWTSKSNIPETRGAGFSSVVDGKIYAVGGYGGPNRLDEYDPSTNTWTTKSDMPTSRHALSTSVVDGKIYAIGGYIPGVVGYPGIKTAEIYDPVTDSWTTADEMYTGRYGLRTSVVDGKIYAIGGQKGWGGTACINVEVYYE